MTQSLMQQLLKDAWRELPPALRKHHQAGPNRDVGWLDLEYPDFMRLPLAFLNCLGALLNARGKRLPCRVTRRTVNGIQYWQRRIKLPEGKNLSFDSLWTLEANGSLTEYINPFLGLNMRVKTRDGRLLFHGQYLVLKLGRLKFPLPEWLLGHTTITEEAVDDWHFAMDFRLHHPWLGEIYRYRGTFRTGCPVEPE